MALTQLEKYGATYGLSDEDILTLQTGFDALRGYNGWSDLAIPEYVWTYIDQTRRDELLSAIKTVCNKALRDSAYYTASGGSKEEWIAFLYMCSLWLFWRGLSSSRETDVATLEASIESDFSAPSDYVWNDYSAVFFNLPWYATHSNGHTVRFWPDGSRDMQMMVYFTTGSGDLEMWAMPYWEDGCNITDKEDSNAVITFEDITGDDIGVEVTWTSYFNSTPRSFCVI